MTGVTFKKILHDLRLHPAKFYDWKKRYGKVNEHNRLVPRDHWLEPEEVRAVVAFFHEHPDVGYRRLTYMMLDTEVVAVSPSTTYNVLKRAGLMGRREPVKSSKGKGFDHPEAPHQHWHIDITYLNIAGTFYYMCSVLDGFSRAIIHWEIREKMKAQDVEIILQRAKEAAPEARPRIISDNGPQFVARDFKEFVRISGMTHVRTSPYYPQSNGKQERFHKTLKAECIRPKTPLSLSEARTTVAAFVQEYNTKRLHSAIGYITPADKLAGRAARIFARRERLLTEARQRRKEKRAARQAA
nr:IS3 family transposase [Acanthopleuribacter pedis]